MSNYNFFYDKRHFILLILLMHFNLNALPKVGLYKLETKNISPQLQKTINAVIFSFIKEIKNYNYDDFENEAAPSEGVYVPFDYIFTGSITALNLGLKLELVLKDIHTKTTRMISKEYENPNKILLESRSIINELFDLSLKLPEYADSIPTIEIGENGSVEKVENLDALAGAWYGEEGVEKIMIMRGGRGIAVLASGVSMLLDLKLDSGILIITQKGPSKPRLFMNLPDKIAALAAKEVKPMVWEFRSSANNNILMGIKKTADIKHNNDEILNIEEITIPVKWYRN